MALTDVDALLFDRHGALIDWEEELRRGLVKAAALSPGAHDAGALLETCGTIERG